MKQSERHRVVFFRPELTQGGADRVTITLLQQFSRAKYDVQLCLLRKAGPLLDEVPADVKIHELKARSLWSAVGPLRRVLRTVRPDVLFSTCSGANVPASIAHVQEPGDRALVLSERNVVIRHPFNFQRVAMPFLKRVLYQNADFVTAVSDGVREDLEHLIRVPRERAVTIGNPVVSTEMHRLAAQPPNHQWFESKDLKVIVNMARLVPQKGQSLLLRAFARVHDGDPSTRLVILGEGPERENLEKLVLSLGLEGAVDLLGFHKNPYRYLSRASVFVLSSWNEGLPGSLIQAMAMGTPAISTDCHAGPSEIIDQPGVNGFLFPVGDEDELVRLLRKVLSDDMLRQTVGDAGKETVRRYTLSEVLRNYEKIVDDSLRIRGAIT